MHPYDIMQMQIYHHESLTLKYSSLSYVISVSFLALPHHQIQNLHYQLVNVLITIFHPFVLACAICMNTTIYVPLCVSRSKGKAGLQLECIPEKRDTNKL